MVRNVLMCDNLKYLEKVLRVECVIIHQGSFAVFEKGTTAAFFQ